MRETSQNSLKKRITALRDFYKKTKRMPTFEEMLGLFDVSSKNAVAKIVAKLEDMGLVGKNDTGRLEAKEIICGVKMLGSVAAGFPTTAEEEIGESINLDDLLVRDIDSSYMLTVSGDSMIDAGIQPGDMVIVDRSAKPKTGDIVVAEVDHDWTLKYFENKNGAIRLIPANKNYKPIIPQEELKIGGVVNAVIRKYK